MAEPTKEAIFAMTISTSGESWATVTKDGALKLDEAKCHALAQEFMNGNVTQGTSIAMLVSAIIAHLRKQARDDALEGAAKICEDVADRYEAQDGGKWPELRADAKDGAQSCEYAIRAMKDKPDGET